MYVWMYVCIYNIKCIPEGGVCGVEMRILGPEETDGAITGGSGLIPCLRPNRKAARLRDLLHPQKKNRFALHVDVNIYIYIYIHTEMPFLGTG